MCVCLGKSCDTLKIRVRIKKMVLTFVNKLHKKKVKKLTERSASQRCKLPTRLRRYCGWDAQEWPTMHKSAKSAISIMRAIKASFINITPTLFDKLSYAPFLKYSFQTQRLWLKKGVQRRSTKLVKGLQYIECGERALLLNLDSWSCGMDKGYTILVYKILHGFLEGVQWQNFFQMADTSRLWGHPLKLRKDRSRLELRKFTFRQRVVNVWNNLPADGFICEGVQKQARDPP